MARIDIAQIRSCDRAVMWQDCDGDPPRRALVASIEQCAGERAIERRARIIEHPLPLFIPMNRSAVFAQNF